MRWNGLAQGGERTSLLAYRIIGSACAAKYNAEGRLRSKGWAGLYPLIDKSLTQLSENLSLALSYKAREPEVGSAPLSAPERLEARSFKLLSVQQHSPFFLAERP